MTGEERKAELERLTKAIMDYQMMINLPHGFKEQCMALAEYLIYGIGVIVPPCNVGDVVYFSDSANVETAKTVAVTKDELGLYISIRQKIDGMTIDDNIAADEFGKIFFLNREEAVAALERMKNDG